ncbi:hypothetical protein E5A73_20870 [Sphingomonas gei]|uniref:Carrier domain-containing protein n=1 Tax=Sphingomonas gei TaxID=1395960 RepID=A0A4S1X381_9SPHN|nr:hypothetical protein [Sphingomonas gei]TGX48666.1 hypothetical protein E5A73_20870 [Sphingomonas gei]
MEFAQRIVELLSRSNATAAHDTDQDQAVSELEIDSLTFMDRIMQIEEQEDIILRDDEVDGIISAFRIRDIVEIFEQARQRRDNSKTSRI